jgi:hypothetical protein
MPRYTRVYSVIRVVGRLWMPQALAATDITLSDYDLGNISGDKPLSEVTREDVEQWLMTHSGDFSEVIDLSVSISRGDLDLEFPWEQEENEVTYFDCMFPPEDY